jgi:hypothetical protein
VVVCRSCNSCLRPALLRAFVRTGDSYTPALVLESRVVVFTWCQLHVLQIKLFRFCGQISSISSSEIAKLTYTLRTLQPDLRQKNTRFLTLSPGETSGAK